MIAIILLCSESDLKLFWLQGEIGLPGPPGHDGEKVRNVHSQINL